MEIIIWWKLLSIPIYHICLLHLSSIIDFVDGKKEIITSLTKKNKNKDNIIYKRQLKKTFWGDPTCPCLTIDELPSKISSASLDDNNTITMEEEDLRRNLNNDYGVGCASHDLETRPCQGNNHLDDQNIDENLSPPWCQSS
jgi:hypothetical protein